MTEISGGCLCGAVRYTVTAEPLAQAVCHCTHCQKQTGTAFSALLVVPADAFRVEGPLTLYEDRGDSGAAVERRFCGRCGSPIYSALPDSPQTVVVKAGTLDDPSIMSPKVNIWCHSAWPWTPIPDGAIRIARSPPARR